jgi:excisionase family DNA binding protein
MTTTEAAVVLGVSVRRVRQLIAAGRLTDKAFSELDELVGR